MFSRRRMVSLLVPLFWEQILTVAIGVADTFMVSGVGEAAVSGVSLVDTLNTLIIQILTALAAGGSIVTSQYLGKKDQESARRSAAQLYSIILLFMGGMMLLCLLFSRMILRFVFGSVSAEVMRMAQIYFLVSAVSYPFMGVYSVGAALFRAQGNSLISLKASLMMNLINVCGNAFLIYGLHMGVLGAAAATLLGRMCGSVWVLLRNQKRDNPLCIRHFRELIPDPALTRRILALGIPSGLENGMFQFGKLSVSSLVSTLGTSAIAAHAVANAVSTVANVPGNTMGLAALPVIGQTLGAGDKKQARHYAGMLMGAAMLGLLCTDSVLYFSIPHVAGWYRLSAASAAECVRVVHCFALFAIPFWASSFTLPNILRAGGDAKYTMLVSISSMWVCRVVLSYFFVLHLGLGLLGVWLGMCTDWVIRSIGFALRFFSGKWMEHKVV